MYLIFDTETTGLPRDFNAPITDTDNWPRCVQIAWQLHDEMGNLIEQKDFLIKPDGYDIPFQSEQIHGISTKLAETKGVDAKEVWKQFAEVLSRSKFVVGQNIMFDVNVMGCELYRYGVDSSLTDLPILDTCTETTAELCQIPGGRGGKFKLPTLTELHEHLFGVPFAEAHNATADVEATTRCFLELIRKRSFKAEELQQDEQYFDRFLVEHPDPIGTWDIKHLNLKAESAALKEDDGDASISRKDKKENQERLEEVRFSHLHNHTQFSILQSTTTVGDLVTAAAKIGSPAVAITDTDNMMAAFQFVNAGERHNNGIKAQIKAKQELLNAGTRIEKNEETGEEKEGPAC